MRNPYDEGTALAADEWKRRAKAAEAEVAWLRIERARWRDAAVYEADRKTERFNEVLELRAELEAAEAKVERLPGVLSELRPMYQTGLNTGNWYGLRDAIDRVEAALERPEEGES